MTFELSSVRLLANASVEPAALATLFAQTDWASGRSAADIERMLAATPLHFSAWHEERLVGFARVIGDLVYRAFLEDVVVDAGFRHRGIGRSLVEKTMARLEQVPEVVLGCTVENVAFYQRFGFAAAGHPYLQRTLS